MVTILSVSRAADWAVLLDGWCSCWCNAVAANAMLMAHHEAVVLCHLQIQVVTIDASSSRRCRPWHKIDSNQSSANIFSPEVLLTCKIQIYANMCPASQSVPELK
jgi:hypothetical protein